MCLEPRGRFLTYGEIHHLQEEEKHSNQKEEHMQRHEVTRKMGSSVQVWGFRLCGGSGPKVLKWQNKDGAFPAQEEEEVCA